MRQRKEDQIGVGEAASVGGLEREADIDQWGCTAATGEPAWDPAVATAISNSGCAASRRSSSPPA
jgi:hypothetical protein